MSGDRTWVITAVAGQHIKLLTRDIGDEGRPVEIVVAVQVGEQLLDLPMGARVVAEYAAGDALGQVTLTLLADTVRFVPAPEATR